MFSVELLVVSIIKSLVEVAGLSLLAQGIVGLAAGNARETNFVYRMLCVITGPVLKIARVITGGKFTARRLALFSWLFLFVLWIGLIYAKSYVCQAQNLACIPAG
ncbi:MAG: hypothetical protein PHY62_03195 [Gallionella sp.]|nr:hypothetical protein [Gallionella sp.]